MRKLYFLKRIDYLFSLCGINLKSVYSLRFIPKYLKNYFLIKKQLKKSNFNFNIKLNYPILTEFNDLAGVSKGHYFHQDLLIAQKIYNKNPKVHIDVGSRIDGFVAHVASFRKIKALDIRPLTSSSKNIEFEQGDIMKMESKLFETCDSLSCLHALEHFGLGRYGDSIDINGHVKGFENMTKMLEKGGIFYFSVPIGPQRIEFNAHRVFDLYYLINELILNKFSILSFSYVDDQGDLYPNQILNKESIDKNFNCSYGCGIFELLKL